MTTWSTANLTIDFASTEVNGRSMGVCIVYNNQKWIFKSLNHGLHKWSHTIELPARVSLLFGGRHGVTTLVDQHNNIVSNMSVKINSICLDGLPCWDYWPEHAILAECDDSDQLIIGSTVCANSRVDLWFNEATAFDWVVKTKLA
jgi:hypothetical protein